MFTRSRRLEADDKPVFRCMIALFVAGHKTRWCGSPFDDELSRMLRIHGPKFSSLHGVCTVPLP